MIRLLFVDDDPSLLAGLRRASRSRREDWSTSFALGGQEALVALASEPFDVVVTDLRMPGMDGPALLEHVARAHPEVRLRVVLSGQADFDRQEQSVAHAHAVLWKPCEFRKLSETIDRLLAG